VSRVSRALILSAALACAVARGATEQSSSPSRVDSPAPEQLQEVTVTAQRADLANRVSKFVDNVAALANGEGLPLWKVPICPSVTGMTRQQGEYLLWRISEIARGAGIPHQPESSTNS
jgi:hypothetical protein